ncbi:MAG: Uma2 family endonuclease [Citrobacter freundii]|nr:MAG: Uma2 family endonuclease [Citrobacter freundii]
MENEVKEPAPKYNRLSPDEYLAMERAAETKHEYYDGEIVAMSGARLKHLQIASNLLASLSPALREKGCRMFLSDMRVATPGRDGYFYPDGSIICGEPVTEDNMFDTLTNPSVIFEILSASTRKYDMFYKFMYYKQIPSLQEYIMIDSLNWWAQASVKEADNKWTTKEYTIEDMLDINTINYSLPFDEIYRLTGLQRQLTG